MVWCRHLVNIYFLLVDISQTEDYSPCELELHLLLMSDRSCLGTDINQRLAHSLVINSRYGSRATATCNREAVVCSAHIICTQGSLLVAILFSAPPPPPPPLFRPLHKLQRLLWPSMELGTVLPYLRSAEFLMLCHRCHFT